MMQSLKAENNTIQAKLSQTVIDYTTKNRYSFFYNRHRMLGTVLYTHFVYT